MRPQVDTVVMDGADPASVRAGIAEVVARHGRIDVLVNNAGSAGPRQPLEKVPLTAEELEAARRGLDRHRDAGARPRATSSA
jgi:malonyl-CoA reductase / 3-hydroxypropionate dehydrogenase (NADP+)